jgi:two-component system sensor histidine kinase YesM
MRKGKLYFSSLKLNQKFIILIFVVVVLPMSILSVLFFHSYKESMIKDKMKNVELNFTKDYGEIQKKTEMCFMSTQVVKNSKNFWDGIEAFSLGDYETYDLIEFYNNEVAEMEDLVNCNPYLYQIRVYIESDDLPEMMPIIYRRNRMMNLSWAKDEILTPTWKYDYKDEIFPYYVLKPTKHLASYVTPLYRINDNINATIEVVTKMEALFPDLYTSTEEEWTCFINNDGSYHYNTDYESRWLKSIDSVYHNTKHLDYSYSEEQVVDGIPVIVCYKPLKELGGSLIKIVSIEDEIASVNRFSTIFWISFIVLVFILIFLSNIIVKSILKQFYYIMNTVRNVQKGNLEVRVPVCSADEIGELGEQVNSMLEHITRLMDDSIKGEILVKDSEIRALQNQINAHFIYNVLESIKMMAEIESQFEISDAVTALGKLLRYSIKWVSKNVTVEEEVDYIKNYLALMNLRFDYEIYLSLNIPSAIHKQKIPKMSLQPIIENAIYHGIEGLGEDTNIYIKGLVYDDYCTIEITDAGRGMTEEQVDRLRKKISGEIEEFGSSGNGIGLKNVQDRIKVSFGDDYGISIASKIECFTKVIVKIPLE